MGKPSDGGPEFPALSIHCGMSLRDWFAGQALAGYRANSNKEVSKDLAIWCYRDADAMLAQREKEVSK